MSRMIKRLASGAVGGLIATAPMTLWMLGAHRLLPRHEQYALPPREITEVVTDETGVAEVMNEEAMVASTLVAHFGFGAAAGVPFALLPTSPFMNIPTGLAYGLMVWSGAYLGLLPAAHVLKPATEHPARRNALMISAHLVWGASLALVTHRLTRSR